MEYHPVRNALDEAIYNSQYQTSEEIKRHLKKWAIENNFVLVVDKSEKGVRVVLRCKHGKACRTTVSNLEERKRNRSSCKNDCPFLFRIKFLKLEQVWVVERPIESKQEHLHNHVLSTESIQVTAEGRKGVIGQSTVKLVKTLIQAGNSVPEILRTLGGRDGQSTLSYDDVRNWRAENTTKLNTNSLDNDARNLVSYIGSKGYLVSYDKAMSGSESRCSLTSIFFMHQCTLEEVTSRGEVFVIDATVVCEL